MQRQPRLHEVAHLLDAEAAVVVEERRAFEDAHRADVHRVLEPLQVQEAGVERGEPVVVRHPADRTGARSLRSTADASRRDHRVDDLARARARARRAPRAAGRQLRERLADLARRRRRASDITLEWRLHPVAGYRTPAGALALRPLGSGRRRSSSPAADPHALRLGDEVRPLTGLWDGLECYAAYGDEHRAARSSRRSRPTQLGRPPDRVGLVDHEAIGDAWERAQRHRLDRRAAARRSSTT